MFGGIVETMGMIEASVEEAGCLHLTIVPQIIFDDLHVGDSIAINGVCLTVTAFNHAHFQVTVVPETRRLTNLNALKKGQIVNLERSLKINARLGGHYVQGHVDATGEILSIAQDEGSAILVKISVPTHLTQYIVKKGYIALDGMSITVIEVMSDNFTVTFIPHTQATTIVKNYQLNQRINIEIDMMGKYIEKLLAGYQHAKCN